MSSASAVSQFSDDGWYDPSDIGVMLGRALLAADDALDKIEDLASSGRATVMAEIVAIARAAMLPSSEGENNG